MTTVDRSHRVRHPDNPTRFLIARSLAPELVSPEDIVELDLDGQPVRDEDRSLYLERFDREMAFWQVIHAAIFAARPDVMAVVHAHAEDTLSFGIAQGTKLPENASDRCCRGSHRAGHCR